MTLTSTESFKLEIDKFMLRHEMKPTPFSVQAVGRPNFYADLQKGLSPTLETVDRVRLFMRVKDKEIFGGGSHA